MTAHTSFAFRRGPAILLAGVLAAGCATSRDIRTLQVQIDALAAEQRAQQARLIRLDSLAREGTDETRRQVVDVKHSVSDFAERLDQIEARIVDLDERLSTTASTSSRPQVMVPVDAPTAGAAPPRSGTTAEQSGQLYHGAFEALKQEDYVSAIAGFQAYVERAADDPQAASATYWIGESFHALQQLDSALAYFQAVLDRYPESDKVPAALFRAGNILTERGDKSSAYPYYRRLKEEFPQSLEYQQLRRRLED